jgi:hypothetical protein
MGWASGLQAGLQLGRAFKEGQERRAMEKIQGATANEIQDYGTSGTQQIQGLQGSGAYDVQAIPGAEGTAPTLRYTPKQGLDLQGDMPAPAGAYIDVAPQRMTEYLGQRYEGGLTPERMETIRTRAMANAMTDPARRQQALLAVTGEERAQDAELRAKATELRTAQGFETQQTAANLTIDEQRSRKKLREDEETRQKANADWWVKQTTDPATGERRAPKPEDFLAASQRDAASYYQTGNYEKGGQAYDAFMSRAEAQILKEEKDRKRESQVAFDAVLKGDYKVGMNFYNKYLPNGSIATGVEPGKDGTLKVSHTDLSGNKLPTTTITRQQLLEGIASYGDSDKAMKYIQQSFSNNLAIKESNQRSRGLDLQERNVVVNEDTAQSNKIEQIKRGQREEQRLNQPSPQTLKQYKDREGNAVLVDVTKLPVDKNGVVQTPKGLVPVTAQTEPSYKDVASAAAKIMEDPKQNKKMVDGKKVPITFEEAAAKARVGLAKQNAASGEDPADRIIRLMKAAQAGNAVDSEID